MYIGVSESMLYKLTSNKEIPHYKPRGKMLYFAKEELDAWLFAKLRTYGGRCHAYGDGSIRNPTVL